MKITKKLKGNTISKVIVKGELILLVLAMGALAGCTFPSKEANSTKVEDEQEDEEESDVDKIKEKLRKKKKGEEAESSPEATAEATPEASKKPRGPKASKSPEETEEPEPTKEVPSLIESYEDTSSIEFPKVEKGSEQLQQEVYDALEKTMKISDFEYLSYIICSDSGSKNSVKETGFVNDFDTDKVSALQNAWVEDTVDGNSQYAYKMGYNSQGELVNYEGDCDSDEEYILWNKSDDEDVEGGFDFLINRTYVPHIFQIACFETATKYEIVGTTKVEGVECVKVQATIPSTNFKRYAELTGQPTYLNRDDGVLDEAAKSGIDAQATFCIGKKDKIIRKIYVDDTEMFSKVWRIQDKNNYVAKRHTYDGTITVTGSAVRRVDIED